MRNSVILTVHFNDAANITTSRLDYPERHIVMLRFSSVSSILLSLECAAEVAKQLTEYLARFSRENDLSAARSADVGGFK